MLPFHPLCRLPGIQQPEENVKREWRTLKSHTVYKLRTQKFIYMLIHIILIDMWETIRLLFLVLQPACWCPERNGFLWEKRPATLVMIMYKNEKQKLEFFKKNIWARGLGCTKNYYIRVLLTCITFSVKKYKQQNCKYKLSIKIIWISI